MQLSPYALPVVSTDNNIPPVAPLGSGWFGGVVRFSGRGPETKALVMLDRILGRVGGYESARGARIAAARLTSGDARPAAAVAQDGDGRFRIYAATLEAFTGADLGTLAFERGLPRSPAGASMDSWLYSPAEGLLELRDGARFIRPNPYGIRG